MQGWNGPKICQPGFGLVSLAFYNVNLNYFVVGLFVLCSSFCVLFLKIDLQALALYCIGYSKQSLILALALPLVETLDLLV